MSGLAVAVDWKRPVGPDIVESMLAMVTHRAKAGSRIMAADGAALGESRMAAAPAWQITTDGDLTIVGDLRLWNTGSLRSTAGGASATQDMDDRRLILCGVPAIWYRLPRRTRWRLRLRDLGCQGANRRRRPRPILGEATLLPTDPNRHSIRLGAKATRRGLTSWSSS